MRVVFAPDSFKESLSAAAAAAALATGWRRERPDDECRLVPMADGGEGTAEAIVAAVGGKWVTRRATGPLGDPVEARYGVYGAGRSAVLEMAAAAGLPLVPPEQRDPSRTSTRGVGELLVHALDQGVRRILLAIGGSATNDAGAGMAQALGYRLLDAAGRELPPGGAALARLARIDAAGAHPALASCRIEAACDVDNPLCGPRGASRVYGPQKGATPEMAAALDAALTRFAEIAEAHCGRALAEVPGAGAAGGLGAGVLFFLHGVLRPGVDLAAEACGLEAHLNGAGLVVTGEGRIDGQTLHGKTPIGVARIAGRYGVPVIAVAGALGPGYEAVLDAGISAVHGINPPDMTLEEAIPRTGAHLEQTAERIAREWNAGEGGA